MRSFGAYPDSDINSHLLPRIHAGSLSSRRFAVQAEARGTGAPAEQSSLVDRMLQSGSIALAPASALTLVLLRLDAWVTMALYAVLEITDALLKVLLAHLGLGMLVTAIAHVSTVVVVLVTGLARSLVVTV